MNPLTRFILLAALLSTLMIGCAPAIPSPTAVPTLAPTATPIPPTPVPPLEAAIEKMHWFGTSAILYQGSQNIYFDPITLEGELPKADLILITHGHNDHWSVEDLLKIIGPNTTLIVSVNASGVYDHAKDQLGIEAKIVREGDTLEVNGVTIQSVPAYDLRFHPRATGGVGFIVTVDDTRLYHAGGTGAYPEMAGYECDIAIIPVYDNASVSELVSLIPAEAFAISHTSVHSGESYASVLGKDFPDKKFVTFVSGALEP